MWVAHLLGSQVAACVLRCSSLTRDDTKRAICSFLLALPGVHIHFLPFYSFTGLWTVTHQFPLCLSNSGQVFILLLDLHICSRVHLFSTHILIFVNQPPVVACLCSEACKTSLRLESLSVDYPASHSRKYMSLNQPSISPNRPFLHYCTNAIWLSYRNRRERPSSGPQVIYKDHLSMEIFFNHHTDVLPIIWFGFQNLSSHQCFLHSTQPIWKTQPKFQHLGDTFAIYFSPNQSLPFLNAKST